MKSSLLKRRRNQRLQFSEATKRMIERCFAMNELETEIQVLLKQLPEEMVRKIGGTKEYWAERFSSNPLMQKLVEDALRWSIRRSQNWSKREGKPIRHYLKMIIDNGDIPEWISWHAKAMEF